MINIIVDKHQELDGAREKFLGYRFKKAGRVSGDMKCLLCGRWFTWTISKVESYILERRWDEMRGEPVHCGKSMCHDYHRRYLRHVERLKRDAQYREDHFVQSEARKHAVDENSMWALFQRLKKKGLVR